MVREYFQKQKVHQNGIVLDQIVGWLLYFNKSRYRRRLTINLVGSSIKEKINEVNTAVKFAINLDSDSKIIFTVNSYYTSIVNEKTDGTNLINGTYKWTYTEGKEVKSSMVNFQVVNLLI